MKTLLNNKQAVIEITLFVFTAIAMVVIFHFFANF